MSLNERYKPLIARLSEGGKALKALKTLKTFFCVKVWFKNPHEEDF